MVISTGRADPIFSFLLLVFLGIFNSSQTNAVDQAALSAFWKGLTSKGTIGWNTTNSLCGQNQVNCISAGKVNYLWVNPPPVLTAILHFSHWNSFYPPILTHPLICLSGLRFLYQLGLAGTISTEIGMLTSLTICEWILPLGLLFGGGFCGQSYSVGFCLL